MELNRSTKFVIAGIVLILVGLLLNQITIWYAYWQTVGDGSPTPPPVATIAGTLFLLLVPVGLIVLFYGLYLRWMESQQKSE